ncbi:MAG: Hsp20/alpha crystallin family protein [bacterium]
MAIKRLDTFREIANIQSEVVRLFDQAFGLESEELILSEGDWRPPIDIYENKKQLIVVVECPGMLAKDIEIITTGNSLTINGIKKEEKTNRNNEEGKFKYICLERIFGNFKRLIRLPFPIDSRGINATFKDGVLVIKLCKVEEKRGVVKNIPINFG